MESLIGEPMISIENENNHVPRNLYEHDLQMYDLPPSGCTVLHALHDWCANRLTVLKLVEKISSQNYKKSSKHCAKILTEELERNNLQDFIKLLNGTGFTLSQEQSLKIHDCASHFLMKSAIAFERDKVHWFAKQETKLFRWRFSSLSKEGIEAFISINKLHCDPICAEEKEKLRFELETSCLSYDNIDDVAIFKVPFDDVLELISRRHIFLKSGFAYIPDTKMSALVVPTFKKKLLAGFRLSREIAQNMTDERIIDIFQTISNAFKVHRFEFGSQSTSLNQLNELVPTSFPLCMSILHKTLRTNHHLKRAGRVQYYLFLKGIGLDLDDALKFSMEEFMKKMDEETYRKKKYAYEIRHLYGTVGCKKDYMPQDCQYILKSVIERNDCHGCPFKTMSLDILKETLSEYGDFRREDIETIALLSQETKYQEACTKYFEITHGRTSSEKIEHPNMYFSLSRKIWEEEGASDSDDDVSED